MVEVDDHLPPPAYRYRYACDARERWIGSVGFDPGSALTSDHFRFPVDDDCLRLTFRW